MQINRTDERNTLLLIALLKKHMILTDSGGIQEEAPSLEKAVLVMRDTIERPEGIAAGTLKLVGTDEETIYKAFKQLLEDPTEYAKISKVSNPYWDGQANRRMQIYWKFANYGGS